MQSVARVWRNKINYSISTPSKAVMFGNTVTVNFTLAPALKGLIIEHVITRLKEAQELKLVVKGRKAGASRKVRIIVEDKYCEYRCVPFTCRTASTIWPGHIAHMHPTIFELNCMMGKEGLPATRVSS